MNDRQQDEKSMTKLYSQGLHISTKNLHENLMQTSIWVWEHWPTYEHYGQGKEQEPRNLSWDSVH